jgi:hypothetical protein
MSGDLSTQLQREEEVKDGNLTGPCLRAFLGNDLDPELLCYV